MFTAVGCGPGGATTAVDENTEQAKIDAYMAEQQKDQQAMDASLGDANAPAAK